MGIIGDVFTKSLQQLRVSAGTEAVRTIKGDVLGPLTGNVIGGTRNPGGAQTTDANGVRRLPEAGVVQQGVGEQNVNKDTRRFVQQFGQPQGIAVSAQESGVGGFLNNLFGGLKKAILPQPGGATERTIDALSTSPLVSAGKRGIAAVGVAVASVGATAEPQNHAPIIDKSTYSADAIAEAKAAGRDVSNMKLTPADPPVAKAAEPAIESAAGNPIATPQIVQKSLPSDPTAKLMTSEPMGLWKDTLKVMGIATQTEKTTNPIVTAVKAKEDFVVAAKAEPAAAAPAKPGLTALDSLIESTKDADRKATLERARQYVSGGPGAGPA